MGVAQVLMFCQSEGVSSRHGSPMAGGAPMLYPLQLAARLAASQVSPRGVVLAGYRTWVSGNSLMLMPASPD